MVREGAYHREFLISMLIFAANDSFGLWKQSAQK